MFPGLFFSCFPWVWKSWKLENWSIIFKVFQLFPGRLCSQPAFLSLSDQRMYFCAYSPFNKAFPLRLFSQKLYISSLFDSFFLFPRLRGVWLWPRLQVTLDSLGLELESAPPPRLPAGGGGLSFRSERVEASWWQTCLSAFDRNIWKRDERRLQRKQRVSPSAQKPEFIYLSLERERRNDDFYTLTQLTMTSQQSHAARRARGRSLNIFDRDWTTCKINLITSYCAVSFRFLIWSVVGISCFNGEDDIFIFVILVLN